MWSRRELGNKKAVRNIPVKMVPELLLDCLSCDNGMAGADVAPPISRAGKT